MRVAAADAAAQGLGVTPGQTLADARALEPGLDVRPADPDADRAFVRRLAGWALRFTPLVGKDGADPCGLVLDISGCAHLFGGEKALLDDLLAGLSRFGLAGRAAIADTVGLAWGAARFGAVKVIPPGRTREALLPLPVAALRLSPETVDALARLGLRTVAQIADAPRAPLAARFGAEIAFRLDQALGWQGEAISPLRPVPALIAERRFAEPIARMEDIEATTRGLAENLSRQLEERGTGARILDLSLFRSDGEVAALSVGTSRPLRDPSRICRLFRERMTALASDWDAGFGYDIIRLAARKAEPLAVRQTVVEGWDEGAGDGGDQPGEFSKNYSWPSPLAQPRIFPGEVLKSAHSPAQPPDEDTLWVVGRGSGPAPAQSGKNLPGEWASSGAKKKNLLRNRPSPGPTEKKQPSSTTIDDDASLADLVDRLTARFGSGRVRMLEARDSHIPERAVSIRPAALALDTDLGWSGSDASRSRAGSAGLAVAGHAQTRLCLQPEPDPEPAPARPLRLFAMPEAIETLAEIPDGPPVSFRWRRVLYRLVRVEGPERIAPEWWLPPDRLTAMTRDYFRLEDTEGRRYWVFRHGLYGTETAAPEWYMHGLFG